MSTVAVHHLQICLTRLQDMNINRILLLMQVQIPSPFELNRLNMSHEPEGGAHVA